MLKELIQFYQDCVKKSNKLTDRSKCFEKGGSIFYFLSTKFSQAFQLLQKHAINYYLVILNNYLFVL